MPKDATNKDQTAGSTGQIVPAAESVTDQVQGEGDYRAARRYDESARKFAQSGRVDEAAREAEPNSEREARDMEEAERAGKARAKK
jgi:hypothetical protein